MTITLRAAQPEDRAFLLAVYATTRDAELASVDWPAEAKAAFVLQQFEAQDHHYRANYSNASYDVIELASSPVGRLYVARRDDEIRVIDIALLPAFTGRGIGTHLLSEIIDEARVHGKRVTIGVERFNPAQHLYRRLGFVDVDAGDVYLQLEWRPPVGDQPVEVNTAS